MQKTVPAVWKLEVCMWKLVPAMGTYQLKKYKRQFYCSCPNPYSGISVKDPQSCCILFCISVLIAVQSWGSIMAVILSLKAWPNLSALEALACIITSHLYKGSRLAKTMWTASAPSDGGFQSRLGCPICLQYSMYPQEPQSWKAGSWEMWGDVGQILPWLLFHHRIDSLKEGVGVLIHDRGLPKGAPGVWPTIFFKPHSHVGGWCCAHGNLRWK